MIAAGDLRGLRELVPGGLFRKGTEGQYRSRTGVNAGQQKSTEVNRSTKRPRFKINEGLGVEFAVNFESQAFRLPLAAI